MSNSLGDSTIPSLSRPGVPNHAAILRSLIETSLDDDKAEDIVSIDLSGKCSFADSMIVASGRSQRHVTAIAAKLQEKLKQAGYPPLSVEGMEAGEWVLIDAGDVVVHLFRPEVRDYYSLEKMWSIPMPARDAPQRVDVH